MKLTKKDLYESLIEEGAEELEAVFVTEAVFAQAQQLNESYGHGNVVMTQEGVFDMAKKAGKFYQQHKGKLKGAKDAIGKARSFAKKAKDSELGQAAMKAGKKAIRRTKATGKLAKRKFAQGRDMGRSNPTAAAARTSYAG
jgi:hypothetical protein